MLVALNQMRFIISYKISLSRRYYLNHNKSNSRFNCANRYDVNRQLKVSCLYILPHSVHLIIFSYEHSWW